MNFTRRETLAGTLGFAATVCAPARAMAELPGSFADPRIRALGAGNGAHCCRNGPCADLFGPIRSVRAGERRADIRSRCTRRTATRPPCDQPAVRRSAVAPDRPSRIAWDGLPVTGRPSLLDRYAGYVAPCRLVPGCRGRRGSDDRHRRIVILGNSITDGYGVPPPIPTSLARSADGKAAGEPGDTASRGDQPGNRR